MFTPPLRGLVGSLDPLNNRDAPRGTEVPLKRPNGAADRFTKVKTTGEEMEAMKRTSVIDNHAENGRLLASNDSRGRDVSERPAGVELDQDRRKVGPKGSKSNERNTMEDNGVSGMSCLLYTSPSPRDRQKSRMPSSA